jgi:protein phosphatase
VLPDCSTFELAAGDRILLCTDGLTKMLSDRDITALLKPLATLDQTCEQLVAEANRRGGDDNVTVVLVEYAA